MSSAQSLRDRLARPGVPITPACFDALSARLVARAGSPLAVMSGCAGVHVDITFLEAPKSEAEKRYAAG